MIPFSKDPIPPKHSLNTHRSCPAAETFERVSEFMERFGITRIANVTGLDRIGIPVTLAIRPNSRSVAVSQGKGMTLDDAKTSALMETVEIWHAENIIEPVLYGRVKDLVQTESFPDLERIPKPAGSSFTIAEPALWMHSTELNTGASLLVPYEMIHADYTHPAQPAHGFFPSSTNGLSSGNHKLEAICHAITEVVERDALSVWHFESDKFRASRRIDLTSVSDDACRDCLGKIAHANLECGVWNITTDVGIPCFLTLIYEPDDTNNHLGLGSGCHPDKAIALRRALTEAAQTRLNYISGARDDLSLDEYTSNGLMNKRAYAEEMLSADRHPEDFQTIAQRQHETHQEDLDWMLAQLNAVDINEVCFVDLTRDEFNIPVVRIIIPGLEAPHDEASYVPGPRAMAAQDRGVKQ